MGNGTVCPLYVLSSSHLGYASSQCCETLRPWKVRNKGDFQAPGGKEETDHLLCLHDDQPQYCFPLQPLAQPVNKLPLPKKKGIQDRVFGKGVKTKHQLDLVAHHCNSRTQEAEAGGLL